MLWIKVKIYKRWTVILTNLVSREQIQVKGFSFWINQMCKQREPQNVLWEKKKKMS